MPADKPRPRRRKPINTFAVVYYGSTGSTWLIATLKNSKGVYVPAFEPLETWQWKTDDQTKLTWLRNAFSPPADRSDATAMRAWLVGFEAGPEFKGPPKRAFHTIGIKVMPTALADQAALLGVFAEKRTRLVFIERANRIKHALSLYRHHEEGKSQFLGSGVQKPTRVKLKRFERWLAESQRQHDTGVAFRVEATALLGGDDVLTLEYEDLVSPEGKQTVITEVSRFLGLSEPQLAGSGFRKSTPDDLRKAVANYDALFRRYRDTELAGYFEA